MEAALPKRAPRSRTTTCRSARSSSHPRPGRCDRPAAHNERERAGDPTAHAEILALRDGRARPPAPGGSTTTRSSSRSSRARCARARRGRRASALLVFGAADPKAGAAGSLYNLAADPRLNHEIEVVPGVRADECGDAAHASSSRAQARSVG